MGFRTPINIRGVYYFQWNFGKTPKFKSIIVGSGMIDTVNS